MSREFHLKSSPKGFTSLSLSLATLLPLSVSSLHRLDSTIPMQPLEQVTSNDSVASVDIGDYQFCVRHGNEACKDCQVDFKEDNSFTAGVDPVPQREAIHVDFTMNKEGEPICKSHKTADCKSCYNFKKQLVKLTKDGQKKAKQDKKNNPISNLFQ